MAKVKTEKVEKKEFKKPKTSKAVEKVKAEKPPKEKRRLKIYFRLFVGGKYRNFNLHFHNEMTAADLANAESVKMEIERNFNGVQGLDIENEKGKKIDGANIVRIIADGIRIFKKIVESRKK